MVTNQKLGPIYRRNCQCGQIKQKRHGIGRVIFVRPQKELDDNREKHQQRHDEQWGDMGLNPSKYSN